MRSAKKAIIILLMIFTMVSAMGGNVAYAAENRQSTTSEQFLHKVEEEFVTEVTYNSAGSRYVLYYNKNLDFNMDEANLLAKIAEYEGGTAKEQEMIMKVIASRRLLDYYPDDIKSIICQYNMFYLNVDFWNSMAEPSEELVRKAGEILENDEVCDYAHYTFKYPNETSRPCPISSDTKHLVTEHYIFY